jgi:hypothetical protein
MSCKIFDKSNTQPPSAAALLSARESKDQFCWSLDPLAVPSPALFNEEDALAETTSNRIPAFPWRLHDMLCAAAREGFENIVSWQPCGSAFKVHDILIFTESILPRHFKTNIYKSFQRQLNIYGFRRLTSGSQKGAYTHELLIRGKPEVCRCMVRTKIKKKGSRSTKLSSASNLVGQRGCGGEKLCTKRSVSCPETKTLRMMANISSMNGPPDQELHLLNVSSMNGAPNQGLSKNLLNGQAKSKPQEEEDPREKIAPGLFRRRSMDFNSTRTTAESAESAEIEALSFSDPSGSQKPDNMSSVISNEMMGDPMDVWDLDSIFEEQSEDNITLSSPRREQDLADFPFATDVADEIINMFS